MYAIRSYATNAAETDMTITGAGTAATGFATFASSTRLGSIAPVAGPKACVITSYSIHYTKLYEFVFLFVLFAAFLLKSGAGEFIINLAMAAMGRSVGGPAKIAVFGSGLMGSISGSAVANTVGTGSITIPMMKIV